MSAIGVTNAVADYWAAYRITFVTREKLLVVPIHDKQDRYRPYREAYDRAERIAYVYDPLRSGDDERAMQDEYGANLDAIDRIDTGTFRALIYARPPSPRHARF